MTGKSLSWEIVLSWETELHIFHQWALRVAAELGGCLYFHCHLVYWINSTALPVKWKMASIFLTTDFNVYSCPGVLVTGTTLINQNHACSLSLPFSNLLATVITVSAVEFPCRNGNSFILNCSKAEELLMKIAGKDKTQQPQGQCQ